MEKDTFLDNLPDTANMILNVLWDNNCEMMVPELTEKVNQKYGTDWSKEHIKEFARLLVSSDYAEKKYHGFKTYYIALGAELQAEYCDE